MVRADFDEAGLPHVNAILKGVPTARAWRMGVADYITSLEGTPVADRIRLRGQAMLSTPREPDLAHVMGERGVAAYEETLIDILLSDLTAR